MLADVDKVIADYKAIGCEYIVVPYVTEERRPGGELFMQMVEEIRAIGEKAKAAGLVLLYHNHDFEFRKLPDGQIGLDYLYANVPADLLQTELDQCWVKYAGNSFSVSLNPGITGTRITNSVCLLKATRTAFSSI